MLTRSHSHCSAGCCNSGCCKALYAADRLTLLAWWLIGNHMLAAILVHPSARQMLLLLDSEEPCCCCCHAAQGVEPLASVDVAMLCSNQSQLLATDTISSTASNTEASKPNTSTKEQQQQQQQPVCGRWSCARWDGEATAEELTATQHGPMFYAAVLFLVSLTNHDMCT